MKKTYINPKMEVVEINHQTLLAGSPQLGGSYTGGTILAPELSIDDDDE